MIWIHRRPTLILTVDKIPSGWHRKAWHYTNKHFFDEQIQDSITPKTSHKKANKEEKREESK
jgi:hypothetical protein